MVLLLFFFLFFPIVEAVNVYAQSREVNKHILKTKGMGELAVYEARAARIGTIRDEQTLAGRYTNPSGTRGRRYEREKPRRGEGNGLQSDVIHNQIGQNRMSG